MNSTQYEIFDNLLDEDLSSLHERYAFQHAVENLGMSPEDALNYAQSTLNDPIRGTDD